MPVALHGGLTRLTGDPVLAGKMISFVLVALLAVLILEVLARIGVPKRFAWGLLIVTMCTFPGNEALWGIRHDLIPTVVAGFAVAHVGSDGRLWDNLGLSSGDVTVRGLVGAPRGFVELVVDNAGIAMALLVLAAVEVVWARTGGRSGRLPGPLVTPRLRRVSGTSS